MKICKILPLIFVAFILSGCVNVDNYKLTNEPTITETETQQNQTQSE